MINFNGSILSKDEVKLTYNNRAFKYGDSIFETIKIKNGRVIFWEDHYFRLMASMRMLRMKIPLEFTLEFLEQEILKTFQSNKITGTCRARMSVYRKDGGLYKPNTNNIDYLIEVKEVANKPKEQFRVDLYKDFYVYSGHLSTIKSNNKLVNTLAAIYAEENDLDNCILLNERKGVVGVTNGNIFLIKDRVIKTPPITEGCLKGIVREKIIEIISKSSEYEIEEIPLTPFEIQKSDEVFFTNSIVGVQAITHYRKKEFKTEISKKLIANLKVIEMTS